VVENKNISVQLDGVRYQVPAEMRLLDFIRSRGTVVPTLCDHPDLTPAGHCRLCVVEVAGRGLVASCMEKMQDGMIIDSESLQVQNSRRSTLELILATHPMDCVTCAKNGRCGLQEVAAHIGVDESRMKLMRTGAPELPTDSSNPFFLRDPNKCVLCGICTRTCSELQGLGALQSANSGANLMVNAGAGQPLTQSSCESCGECVVRCPTGALVVKSSQAPSREVRTTCTYCGVGCGIHLGIRGNKIVSARGEQDNPVNEGRLCVKGRFGYSFIHSPERLKTPLIKKDGVFHEASWDEALDLIASRFKDVKGSAFAGISSSRATNEENYLMQKFVRAVMQTNNIDNCARLCHAPTVSGLSKSFGTGGGTNPLSDIDGAECLLVVGSNTTEAHAVAGSRLRRAARNAKLIVVDPREIELVRHADLWLPLRPGTDVVLLMGMAKLILDRGLEDKQFIQDRCESFDEFKKAAQGFDIQTVARLTGVDPARIIQAAEWYGTIKPAMILWSLGITEHTHGTDNVMALANLAMLTGNIGKPSAGVMPMRGQNNVQGACDMGCVPNSYPGSQAVTKPEIQGKFEKNWGVPLSSANGLTLVEMLQGLESGRIKAMYIMGMDVAFSVSDTQRTQDALRKAEFLVVQDIFLTGTAKFADVVLPAASFAEKDGTFTNLERRVQLIRKAIPAPGEAKPDWWIVQEIARRMGAKGFDFESAAEIMDEMAGVTPYFAGLNFVRLEKQGVQWPCTSPDHPGTPRLHVEKFNTQTGKGRFAALTYRPSFETTDADYPFLLMTGRSLYHFHLAMTTQVEGLMKLHPEELCSLHPEDAKRVGVKDGERVEVSSRRGKLIVRAKVTRQVQEGMAFMTFHFYEQPTNVLTHQELDPVSKTPEFKVTAVQIRRV